MVATLLSHPGKEALVGDLQYEYLREAGFLIDRRRSQLEADDFAWADAASDEARAAHYLRTLRLWGIPAAQLALTSLDSPDSCDDDLVLGSIATIAMGGDPKVDLPNLLSRFVAGDERTQALWRGALGFAGNDALGAAFVEVLVAAIPSATPEQRPALANLAIARTSAGVDKLLHLLKNQAEELSVETRDTISLALGRVGHGAARTTVARFWGHAPSVILREALLLLGHFRALPRLRKDLSQERVPTVRELELLGLAGDAHDALLLHRAYEQGDERVRGGALEAMGWLGASESVPLLVEATRQSEPVPLLVTEARQSEPIAAGTGADSAASAAEIGAAAYAALQRITAFDLTPDQAGEPRALDRWWAAAKTNFKPETRYRFGQPYSVEQSLHELEAPRGRFAVRRMLAAELRLRSGHMIAFDPSFTVARQQQAFAQWHALGVS